MNLFSKLTYAIAGMAVAGALVAGTAVTFAQDDVPADAPAVTERDGGRRGGAKLDPTVVADVLGITVEELEAFKDEGMRLDDIIAELGLDEDTVKEELQALKQAAKMDAAAEVLGISVDELQTRLDDGESIRDIADELGVDLPQRRGRRGGGANLPVEDVANVLGITVEELEAFKDEGMRMGDIIEELGLDEDTVKEELQALKQAARLTAGAELLGISEAELQERLDNGESFRDIAEELGVELPERNGRRGNGGGAAPAVEGDNA